MVSRVVDGGTESMLASALPEGVVPDPYVPPVVDWRAQAGIDRDAYRDRLLNVLSRMLSVYQATGDTTKRDVVLPVIEAVTTIKQDVQAIYDNPATTAAEYYAAVKARWLQIVAPASNPVKTDFIKYGGNTV